MTRLEATLINDGFGDVLQSHELRLKAVARDATGSNPAEFDDMLQEGRIAFWNEYESAAESEYQLASSFLAAKRRMRNLMNPERRETLTGHVGLPGHIAPKTEAILDTPSNDGEEALAETLLGAADALAGVELAYHHGEILQALRSLPKPQQEYVIMRFWHGLNNTEIAAKMEVTSKVLSHRWERTIRPKLAESLGHLAGVART